MPVGFIDGKLVYERKGMVDVLDIEETHLVVKDSYCLLYYSNGAIHINCYEDIGNEEFIIHGSEYDCDEPTDIKMIWYYVLLFYDSKCVVLSTENCSFGIEIGTVVREIDNFPLADNFAIMTSVDVLNGDKIYNLKTGVFSDTDIAYITGKYIFKKDGTSVCTYNVTHPSRLKRITDLVWINTHCVDPEICLFIDGRYYMTRKKKYDWLVGLLLGTANYKIKGDVVRPVKSKDEKYWLPDRPTFQVKSARNV